MKPTKPESNPENPQKVGSMTRLVRLSDSVRALDDDLGKRVRALEIQLESAKRQHCFCPDCRDKVREEECLRCQVQRLTRKLRKYEPNDEDAAFLIQAVNTTSLAEDDSEMNADADNCTQACDYVPGSNQPCATCPRLISTLYRCGLLQEAASDI